MIERLIIKNFGPIKSAEIEIRKFTILIGEQATGKSTIAKLLAVCRYFSYINESRLSSGFLEGLNNWGINEFIDTNSQIIYSCPDYSFSFRNDKLNSSYGSNLRPESERFAKLCDEVDNYNDYIPPSFYLNNASNVMDNPFFLPAERGLQSIFSLGKNSIQNISDSLFNQLAKLDQVARTFNQETYIDPLKIYYKNESGRGYFRKENDDHYYSLFNAATGFQSTIPIVLACKYYHNVRKKAKTFIVEEPELNLFPSSQKSLIYFLVEERNSHKFKNKESSFLINTHSPYILTSLNNLMTAFNTAKVGDKRTKVSLVLSDAYWLNPEDVSAYMLKSDGTIEDIIDREEGLINAEKIDGISRELNEEFDKLLKIEFNEA